MRNGVADLAVVTQRKGSRAASGIVRAKGRSAEVVDGNVTSARTQRKDLVDWLELCGGVIDLQTRSQRRWPAPQNSQVHSPRTDILLQDRCARNVGLSLSAANPAACELAAKGIPVISVNAAAATGFRLRSHEKQAAFGLLSGPRPQVLSGCRSDCSDAEEFSSLDATHCCSIVGHGGGTRNSYWPSRAFTSSLSCRPSARTPASCSRTCTAFIAGPMSRGPKLPPASVSSTSFFISSSPAALGR